MTKKVGGHSNYNAAYDGQSKRSITFPVASLPFSLQRKVLVEVLLILNNVYICCSSLTGRGKSG